MFEVKIILGENSYPLKISSKIVSDAQDYFNKLDADMNKGWKMSKSWVDNPNQVQRWLLPLLKHPFLQVWLTQVKSFHKADP